MELDRKILAYVAYRASRSALIHQLNELTLTINAIKEVMSRLNIPPEKKAEVDQFFKEAQQDFGQMLKASFEKVKEETLKTAEAYLRTPTSGEIVEKDSTDGGKSDPQ